MITGLPADEFSARSPIDLSGLYLRAWPIFEYERADWAQTYYRFDTRMSGLVFGALLAIGLPRLRRISEKTANVAGTFACIALVHPSRLAGGVTPGFGVDDERGRDRSCGVSDRSLGPNVMGKHAIVDAAGGWYQHQGAASLYQTASLVLTFAITVATIAYMVFERPLQRYRRSLGARRLGTGTANDERAPAPVRAAATTVS